LRQLARQELEPRLRELAAQHDLRPGRVSIRNQRSRWGFLCAGGNIALNFRLVQMPPAIRDYVLLRADASAAAESLSTLLAARRAGLPGIQRGRAMAARRGRSSSEAGGPSVHPSSMGEERCRLTRATRTTSMWRSTSGSISAPLHPHRMRSLS
jgi:hypothetical protein